MRNTILTLLLISFLTASCGLQATTAPQTPPVAAEASTGIPPSQTADPSPRGYITFAINVHDWVNVDNSADIIIRLVDLFEKYGVRGDFYFTAPVVEKYVTERPDVIEKLKNSNMTISYHVRPPHPLYSGFDQSLQGLSDDALYQTLLDYETYGLDMSTGGLDRSRPGGYTYVAQVFGRKPIVVPAPNNNPRIKDAAQRVYAALGAQMTLLYHEEGTKVDQPFEYVNSLLVRPSDFSVTRVTSVNGSDNFWWNYMTAPNAAKYNPTAMLQSQLAEWESQDYPRVPFITSLIHENNFYRSGPESWTPFYFSTDGNKKAKPLSPPFDLSAPDTSHPRTEQDQAAIFAAYEEMVAYAAQNLQVITSEDILKMAKQ